MRANLSGSGASGFAVQAGAKNAASPFGSVRRNSPQEPGRSSLGPSIVIHWAWLHRHRSQFTRRLRGRGGRVVGWPFWPSRRLPAYGRRGRDESPTYAQSAISRATAIRSGRARPVVNVKMAVMSIWLHCYVVLARFRFGGEAISGLLCLHKTTYGQWTPVCSLLPILWSSASVPTNAAPSQPQSGGQPGPEEISLVGGYLLTQHQFAQALTWGPASERGDTHCGVPGLLQDTGR